MRFRLAPGSMTLDDLELRILKNFEVQIFGEFHGIFKIWDATTAK